MWELSGCAKPLDAHIIYPHCPSPPLIEGCPGASFTWRFPYGSKERCHPAVEGWFVRHPYTKACVRHTHIEMAAILFAIRAHEREGGGGQ